MKFDQFMQYYEIKNFRNKFYKESGLRNYNGSHNILGLFDILPNSSETGHYF